MSPSGLSMRSPAERIAARCAPRATKCTSAPACCNRAPKKPPTPPAPMMAIFIGSWLVVRVSCYHKPTVNHHDEPPTTNLPRGHWCSEQRIEIDFVHVVDDLRKDMRRLLEPRRGHSTQRIHVRVVHGVVDDVEAWRILEEDAELAARSRLGARVQGHSVVFEVLHHDRLQLIAATDEPAPGADLIGRVQRVAD